MPGIARDAIQDEDAIHGMGPENPDRVDEDLVTSAGPGTFQAQNGLFLPVAPGRSEIRGVRGPCPANCGQLGREAPPGLALCADAGRDPTHEPEAPFLVEARAVSRAVPDLGSF